jgi:uncharacterized protein (DUF58 family)
MKHRVTFLLFIMICLVFVTLLSRNAHLSLLSLPLLAYLAVGVFTAPRAIRLRAVRTVTPMSVTANAVVEVRVCVENEGSTTLFVSLLDADFPSLPLRDGCRRQSLALPPGEQTDLFYSFLARRGSYDWKTLRVTAADPFGLFEKTVDVPASASLLVFSGRTKMRHLALRPRRLLQTCGPFLARQAGPSTDIWGVREYQPSDPLRWIDWPRSARQPGQFFTKEFEREAMADIGLILDAHGETREIGDDDGLFAWSVQAAASLAEGLVREGNRVGLLVLGERVSALFPGTGKGQWLQIQRRLAQARTGPNGSLDRLKYLPARMFPSRALLMVISPLGPRAVAALTRLRALGYPVLLISPDPVGYAAIGLPEGRSRSLAVRLAHCERSLQFWQLRQRGVEVIDWPVDQALNNVIQTVLRKRHTVGHR